MDVEALLTQHIGKIGGVHVRTIVGDSPDFDNADFLFRADNVIAELKCLDEDLVHKPEFIDKATNIHLEDMKTDKTAPVVFGTVYLTTKGRSDDFKKKIRELYFRPFKQAIEKANKQIKTTAEKLSIENPQGLVILANNNHTALEPGHAKMLLDDVFRRQTYRGINSVVYVSAGQGIQVVGETRQHDIFMEYRNPHAPQLSRWFLDRIRAVWIQALAAHRGHTKFNLFNVGTSILRSITNRPKK